LAGCRPAPVGYLDGVELDVVWTHPVTGNRTPLAESAKRALEALRDAEVPHAVIRAAALAARGLPRMTRDLDVVVVFEDAFDALRALGAAGFESAAPIDWDADPEAMYVDLTNVERYLADVHPEMLSTLKERVDSARHPPPTPPRPPRRARK
jgi:hypothetical protein